MVNLALENITGDVFTFDEKWMQQGIQSSRESKRRRVILPLHRAQESPVQRMFNFLQPDTYIRPHKHGKKGASETVILVQGALTFLTFSEDGQMMQKYQLEASKTNCMIDIEPNVWHSFVVHHEDTIILEVKCGPYDAEGDKVFAPWAPEEFSPEAQNYMQAWR